jgi:hypothetical protein
MNWKCEAELLDFFQKLLNDYKNALPGLPGCLYPKKYDGGRKRAVS